MRCVLLPLFDMRSTFIANGSPSHIACVVWSSRSPARKRSVFVNCPEPVLVQ